MQVAFRASLTSVLKMDQRSPFQTHSANPFVKTWFAMQLHPAEQTVDKPTVPDVTLESVVQWPV
jgi:hypothetical protein